MAGNETEYKSPRNYLPVFWWKDNILAGQATGLPMTINNLPFEKFPFAKKASLVTLGIVLSEAITAGLIRFEITKNGTATGKTFDMDASKGKKALWEFDPGILVGGKGDELGILWGSSGTLAPAGVIEAAIFVEVQET